MKRPSLAEAMSGHDTSAAPMTPPVELPIRKPAAIAQPGRVGKKQVLGYFSTECKKQLKQMGVDMDKTEQDLLAEALNDLFVKYGKPTIA